ncbi:MAG: PQQ-binding-like beta-propeller repeat protein [Deltaproteobacteria bacterium]|nr:PQQ-binding-like beta-propeller repeat protein [Deltaproteobacteria bacterium]
MAAILDDFGNLVVLDSNGTPIGPRRSLIGIFDEFPCDFPELLGGVFPTLLLKGRAPRIVGIDVRSGVPRWSRQTLLTGVYDILVSGHAAVTLEGETIQAFDLQSGEVYWAFDLGDYSGDSGTPHFFRGLEDEVVVSTETQWTTLELHRGSVLRHLPSFCNIQVVEYGIGYCSSGSAGASQVSAFDITTGTQLWRKPLEIAFLKLIACAGSLWVLGSRTRDGPEEQPVVELVRLNAFSGEELDSTLGKHRDEGVMLCAPSMMVYGAFRELSGDSRFVAGLGTMPSQSWRIPAPPIGPRFGWIGFPASANIALADIDRIIGLDSRTGSVSWDFAITSSISPRSPPRQ